MDDGQQPIAHAACDENGVWRAPHALSEHLAGVAALAACFARNYGEDWARLAGQWHDLGKYRPRFQLCDYAEWQERETKSGVDSSPFRLMRHYFKKETWDWAIARLLMELPEYREWVQAWYALGENLEAANPGREKS